jgi:hypothetical protein
MLCRPAAPRPQLLQLLRTVRRRRLAMHLSTPSIVADAGRRLTEHFLPGKSTVIAARGQVHDIVANKHV